MSNTEPIPCLARLLPSLREDHALAAAGSRSLTARFVALTIVLAQLLGCLRRRVPGANTLPARAPTHVRPRLLTTITAEGVTLPDPSRWIHLQFRRFAGCPVCNLHLQSFIRRHDELRAARVREVVVFHSSAEALRDHASRLPFAVVPDPDRVLYAEFGVESSVRALLDPRAWIAIVLGVARSLVAVLRGREPLPAVRPQGGSLGLPADFLIAPDGRVVAAQYGVHADDQWSVAAVIELASRQSFPG